MKPLRVAPLRHYVEIQDYTEEQDSSGDLVKGFGEGSQAYAVVRASIRTLRGRELLAAQSTYAEADAEIRIRYLDGVSERMRVKHGDTYYDILNVDDVERRHIEMILTCRTGLADDA
jgi:SPP1 family predicted phage head-tail adaptor